MQHTILAPLNADFFLHIHIQEYEGKTDTYAIIEYATLSQDDSLIHETEVTLHSSKQKEIIKNCLINNSHYSNAFYTIQEAKVHDLRTQKAWEKEYD